VPTPSNGYAACVILAVRGEKDFPNDALVSYKIRNQGDASGPLTVTAYLTTSRGTRHQSKTAELGPGEERSSYFIFSLAGTDGSFKKPSQP
jgi:hypothetical protein